MKAATSRVHARKLFATAVHPPWICYWCGKKVKALGRSGQVHHLDLDPFNNRLENLVVMHAECHGLLHWWDKEKGRKFAKEWKDSRRSATASGKE